MMMLWMYLFSTLNFLLMLVIIIPSNLIKFNPLTLSLLLVIYMIMICFKLNFFNMSFWYSYILFLIMIGGLMILFIYFTSLVSNQLFYFQMNFSIYLFMKIILLMVWFYYMMINIEWLMNLIMLENNFNEMNFMMEKFFKNLYINLMMDFKLDMTLYMIFYLFLTMISVVLICLKAYLPLRQLMKY